MLVRLKILETGNVTSAKVPMSLFMEVPISKALHGILGTQASPVLEVPWPAQQSRGVPQEAAGALSREGRALSPVLCTHDWLPLRRGSCSFPCGFR